MKIAVAGGEGTGRTTVAEAVARAVGAPLLPNPRDGLLAATQYHTLFEWQAATGGMARLLHQQAERERSHADAVVDAGMLDLWCFIERWVWNRMSPDHAETLRVMVAEAADRYTLVLVTSPQIVAPPAPGRFLNRMNVVQSQRLLDALLVELLPRAKVLRLPAGDAPAVVAAALSAVS